MKRGLVFVLAFIPAVVALPPGQRNLRAAVPGEREARNHHRTAEARFHAGLFAEALAEYQAGYQAMPLPGFLINIAQCYRRLGDLRLASGTYRKFTVVAPDSPLTPQIKALIAEIDRREVDFENARRNGTVPADGEQDQDIDQVMPYAVFVNPPATAEEEPAPALLARTPPASEREPRGESATRWWLWGSIGAAVVCATVAAIILSTGGSTATQEGSLATLRR
jgi:tetratricopeptide (TPR) repeat protein